MFDVGFQEMAVIAVIGLIVIGPDRLPKVARQVGLWVGRIRRYVSQVKADIEREVRAEELRELASKQTEDLYKAVEETKGTLEQAKETIEAGASEAGQAITSTQAVGPDEGKTSAEAIEPDTATVLQDSGAGMVQPSAAEPEAGESKPEAGDPEPAGPPAPAEAAAPETPTSEPDPAVEPIAADTRPEPVSDDRRSQQG